MPQLHLFQIHFETEDYLGFQNRWKTWHFFQLACKSLQEPYRKILHAFMSGSQQKLRRALDEQVQNKLGNEKSSMSQPTAKSFDKFKI